jgi:Flp pilus assembly secretin CpaC
MPAEKHAKKAPVIALVGVLAAAAPCLIPLTAHADEELLRVFMDHARILKLDRPVSKVIVGNSDVADATVADDKTIVLTGRNFGTTNIVLLDANGNAILDERILVSIDEANTVRVYRQTERSVLSCTPNCEQHAEKSDTTSTSTTPTSSSAYSAN